MSPGPVFGRFAHYEWRSENIFCIYYCIHSSNCWSVQCY